MVATDEMTTMSERSWVRRCGMASRFGTRTTMGCPTIGKRRSALIHGIRADVAWVRAPRTSSKVVVLEGLTASRTQQVGHDARFRYVFFAATDRRSPGSINVRALGTNQCSALRLGYRKRLKQFSRDGHRHSLSWIGPVTPDVTQQRTAQLTSGMALLFRRRDSPRSPALEATADQRRDRAASP